MKKIPKEISIVVALLLLTLVVVVSGVAAQTVRKPRVDLSKRTELFKHTNIRGVISNVNTSAHTFRLTTRQGKTFIISTDRIVKKQANLETKRRAQEAKRAARSARRPTSTSSNPPEVLPALVAGMTVSVSVKGEISGTTLFATNVHPILARPLPQLEQ